MTSHCLFTWSEKTAREGEKPLENVFPYYLWFGLCVYPTWCGIVSLVESGDVLAPSCAPGSVNQGGGAVRGALPCYPEQMHHTTAQQARHLQGTRILALPFAHTTI